MGHAGEHHHSDTPPGWTDMIVGFILFVLVSEGVRLLVLAIKPEMNFSREILLQMQISGGLFFLVWASLGKQVFEPFLEAAIARERATVGASKEAHQLREEARLLDTQLQEVLRHSRLEGIRKRDQQVEVAKQKANELVEAAKKQGIQQLAEASRKLHEAALQAEAALGAESEALTRLVLDRVLEDSEPRQLH